MRARGSWPTRVVPPLLALLAAEARADDDAAPDEPHLGLRLGAGLGVTGRTFRPGPATITGYRSTPVPAARVGLATTPAPWLDLALSADRTLAMTSRIGEAHADTVMTGWQVRATVGAGRLAALVGAGSRRFAIISASMRRSPDSAYGYLAVGGEGRLALGRRATLVARAAVEPVVAGAQPTEPLLGAARRWGLELDAQVDLALPHALHLTLAAGYQRFAWSWPTAGARGAGGAVDHYPAAALGLAAAL